MIGQFAVQQGQVEAEKALDRARAAALVDARASSARRGPRQPTRSDAGAPATASSTAAAPAPDDAGAPAPVTVRVRWRRRPSPRPDGHPDRGRGGPAGRRTPRRSRPPRPWRPSAPRRWPARHPRLRRPLGVAGRAPPGRPVAGRAGGRVRAYEAGQPGPQDDPHQGRPAPAVTPDERRRWRRRPARPPRTTSPGWPSWRPRRSPSRPRARGGRVWAQREARAAARRAACWPAVADPDAPGAGRHHRRRHRRLRRRPPRATCATASRLGVVTDIYVEPRGPRRRRRRGDDRPTSSAWCREPGLHRRRQPRPARQPRHEELLRVVRLRRPGHRRAPAAATVHGPSPPPARGVRRRGGGRRRPAAARAAGPRARGGRVVGARRAGRAGRDPGRGRRAGAGEETGLEGVCGRLLGWAERIDDESPLRDPRLRGHGASAGAEPVAGDDAAEAAWVPLREVAERRAGRGPRRVPPRPRHPPDRITWSGGQRPFQPGGRFSMKAVRTLGEVLGRASHAPSPSTVICQPTSSAALVPRARPRRLSRTATGALAQIRSARAMRRVERLARLDQLVHQPEVVGPGGVDRDRR